MGVFGGGGEEERGFAADFDLAVELNVGGAEETDAEGMLRMWLPEDADIEPDADAITIN